ncbi:MULTISPECIES: hypothetical protein [unclassified Blastococcus]
MVRGTTAGLLAVALGLAACGGPPSLPDAAAHVEVESVTEVRLNGDGRAVLTFSSEENHGYLVYAVGATAAFANSGEVEAGVELTWYSLPESEAEIVVRGEPDAEVLVSLQLLDGADVPLGGSTVQELAIGDCANHWLNTGGVDELVAVLTGDVDRLTSEQGYVSSQEERIEQRADADGNPVFTTTGSDGFSYRVCNTSDAPASYELRTAEQLEPGEEATPPPSVDGQPSVSGTVPAGEVRVHRVFVPAGYEALVLVEPDPEFDVEFRSYDAGGGYGHLASAIRGEAEYVHEYGDEPAGSTALLLVGHDPDTPMSAVGSYTITIT